jgi:hypothetical protein
MFSCLTLYLCEEKDNITVESSSKDEGIDQKLTKACANGVEIKDKCDTVLENVFLVFLCNIITTKG